MQCSYRPIGYSSNVRLSGRIESISRSGISLEAIAKNMLHFSHEPGDEFHIYTVLPNGKELSLSGKIVSVKRSRTPGKLFLGMSITEIKDEAKKSLGFFMMP